MKKVLWMALVIGMALSVGATDRYVSLSGTHQPPFTNWFGAATNIQKAVNLALSNETVWVTNGTYTLTSTILISNSITLKSVNGPYLTTIEGNYPQSTNTCIYLTNCNATIIGFRIIHGHSNSGVGGIQLLNGGSVDRCIITDNWGQYGGGVSISGAGVVRNSLILRNYTAHNGGGVDTVYCGLATVENCTIISNTAAYYGGGICEAFSDNREIFRNNIVYWNNASTYGPNTSLIGTNQNTCTLPMSSLGTGNITNNPIFLNPSIDDYHLTTNSPCINTGTNQTWMTNAFDLDGSNRIIDGIGDMGAYEADPNHDADSDGLPDWWELQYFGNITNANQNADPNYDGRSLLQDYQSGSNPTNLVALGDRYVSLIGHNKPPFTNWWQAATTIQAAVDSAVAGENVWVTNGVFILTNQISITKGISVVGINGPANTFVNGNFPARTNRCFYMTDPSATIDGFSITNGFLSSGDGAGVWNSNGTIKNCNICGNVSSGWGGAVRMDIGGLLDNCKVVNNNGYHGGGVQCQYSAIMRNCLVANNGASYGGGVETFQGGTIINCTIANNTSGIQVRYSATIVNSIVWQNGGNEIANSSSAAITNSCISIAVGGTGNITNNPQFVNSASNNFHLLPNSSCLDKGVNQSWMPSGTDLDGKQRIQNGVVDMGAYEYGFTIGMRFSAVDIYWDSSSGTTYQVQSSTDLVDSSWTNIGTSVTATGTSSYVVDWIRDYSKKYYRVVQQ